MRHLQPVQEDPVCNLRVRADAFLLVVNLKHSTASKNDTYLIDTSNVLFIVSGAFVGLDKIVKHRVSKAVCPVSSRCTSLIAWTVHRVHTIIV